MEKICCVFAAGEYKEKPIIPEGAFIIAADGGEKMLLSMGIKSDLTLGDFDSLKTNPQGKEIIRYPVKKDDTDTHLAIKEGLLRGYKIFYIFGACGGRLDHTIANMQSLSYLAENGARGFLINGNEMITAIKNSSFKIEKECDFSVFALSGIAEGVSIKGALYEAENITLTPSIPLGVSNSTSSGAEISVKNGTLHILLR